MWIFNVICGQGFGLSFGLGFELSLTYLVACNLDWLFVDRMFWTRGSVESRTSKHYGICLYDLRYGKYGNLKSPLCRVWHSMGGLDGDIIVIISILY